MSPKRATAAAAAVHVGQEPARGAAGIIARKARNRESLESFWPAGMQPNPEVGNDLDGFGNMQASLGPAIYSENDSVQRLRRSHLDVESASRSFSHPLRALSHIRVPAIRQKFPLRSCSCAGSQRIGDKRHTA